MRNEGHIEPPDTPLVGECPLQKPSRCGAVAPFHSEDFIEMWAQCAYDALHGETPRFVLGSNDPMASLAAQMRLSVMVQQSCEGNA
jgi:hypothetical protein